MSANDTYAFYAKHKLVLETRNEEKIREFYHDHPSELSELCFISCAVPIPPLIYAIENNLVSVVKLLLDLGADIEQIDGNSQTAIGWAIWKGYQEVIDLLMSRGSQLNVSDCQKRRPPLFECKKVCDLDFLYNKYKIDLNRRSDFGSSYLISQIKEFGCYYKDSTKAVIVRLLELGVDCTIEDNCGRTALTCAQSISGFPKDILQLLEEKAYMPAVMQEKDDVKQTSCRSEQESGIAKEIIRFESESAKAQEAQEQTDIIELEAGNNNSGVATETDDDFILIDVCQTSVH